MNQKKKPIHLPTQSQPVSLDADSYGEIFRRWENKSSEVTKKWRSDFVSCLKNKQHRWRELILEGGRNLSRDERENIGAMLHRANGDPLIYLSLKGIPPLAILPVVEEWEARRDVLTRLRQRLRSRADWKEDIKLFRKTARHLDAYWVLLGDEANRIKESLTKLASTIESTQEHHRLPLGTGRKGGPPRVEFPAVVTCLAWIVIIHEIGTNGLKTASAMKIQRHLRPYWGPITAILIAAFPEWFNGAVNPIRNVKNAYRGYGKTRGAVDTPLRGNISVYAPPGHLEKLKWWELARRTRR